MNNSLGIHSTQQSGEISKSPDVNIQHGIESEPSSVCRISISKELDAILIPEEPREKYRNDELIREHLELLKLGENPLRIIQLLGKRLNISPWERGTLYGKRQVLSAPENDNEMRRLQKYVESLGKTWSKANGISSYEPKYLLLDSYVKNALFGNKNMLKVDEILQKFHQDWEAMGSNYHQKSHYLFSQINFDIRKDWSRLISSRNIDGTLGYIDTLSASGSLEGVRLWVHKDFSSIGPVRVHCGNLCFTS